MPSTQFTTSKHSESNLSHSDLPLTIHKHYWHPHLPTHIQFTINHFTSVTLHFYATSSIHIIIFILLRSHWRSRLSLYIALTTRLSRYYSHLTLHVDIPFLCIPFNSHSHINTHLPRTSWSLYTPRHAITLSLSIHTLLIFQHNIY